MVGLLSLLFIVLSVVGCSSEETSIPDEPTTTEENVHVAHNRWIYSQMNLNYLWRLDMPDSLACNYELDPPAFFKSLLSEKDRFSYLRYNSSYSPKEAMKLGFAYQQYVDSRGVNAFQVLYTTSDDVVCKGIRRGDFFSIIQKTSDFVDIQRVSLDESRSLFQSTNDVIRVSRNPFHQSTVIKDSVYHIDTHRIGYICYTEFEETSDLRKPFKKFADDQITDLVLDLRYNPGGYVSTCKYLCNCIVTEKAYGNIFQQLSYNDVLSKLYKQETGNERTYTYFSSPDKGSNNNLATSFIPLNMDRVFVLVSSKTASASEATIMCLSPYMEVVVLGDKTVGKGVGSHPISDNQFEYSLNLITFRYYNASGESTPDEGIVPDFFVSDQSDNKLVGLGDIEEPLLNAALQLIIPNHIRNTVRQRSVNLGVSTLKKVGEPSFVHEFNNKKHQYEY